jgi:hypothetical protein
MATKNEASTGFSGAALLASGATPLRLCETALAAGADGFLFTGFAVSLHLGADRR